ncbi:DNA polymerase III subunit alpha [Polluticaenibacter yanchengensis]|uniref:DNA polymerase III subunit alpha n=1 Tax=Polluticaenibacter yanchengensis TaxID=3014562 RepID=A0ABT4UK85_9BACT|nr:DNA polymerase III subunit alpha [Chitinophagaceae bacterium LY-5]
MNRFSHLHVHTQYSLLDGAASISSLYKKANKFNMPALAITDHGNMFGVFDFVAEAWKNTKNIGKDENGKDIIEPVVKPVVGCEFYVVENRHQKAFTGGAKDKRFHQVLLAKNKKGYENLVKLTSLGYIEGLYGKYPRIDKELILKYSEGLIATTCCIGASVPQAILFKSEEEAEKEFKWWLDVFGEDYFVELQRHNMKEQEQINAVLIKFAKKHNVPMIATNDSHYTDKDDYNAHDILLCVNTGEKQSTPGFDDITADDTAVKNKRFKFPNDQFYFKSPEEMTQLFNDIPESIDNTQMIVDRVEVLNLKKDILLPAFPIPKAFQIHEDNNLNQWEYLQHITYEGAKQRYGEISGTNKERIDFELFTIKTMGFAGYFLIVSDFIKAGRDLGVFVGPGRGSAAGSAVAYCIGITNIDPIKYNLLFERFLNPDRKSMPDIDTDFDDDGRAKVLNYVVEKYGANQVAQIVTYGTMAAKSAIKDVARVMDLPLQDSNMLAKLVPDKPGTNLGRMLKAPFTKKEAPDGVKSIEEKEGLSPEDLENVKKLREYYNGKDILADVLHEAERLEGSIRNTGIHAAGIIIAPKDLTELIPVSISKETPLWITQIEGKSIEEAGVIKMDFLGLKTLSILKTCLRLIKQNHGIDINPDDLPLDDEETYRLYQRGETNATFQFESPGMQKHLRDLKPDQFADLIAMNALYRPGPLQYIPNFIARKHGREEIVYDLPEMEEYLAETYGITVYQEQVMLLSQSIGGFSKGNADVLRKAMGKKDRKTLDKMKGQFIDGAVAKGHPADKLEKIWTDWEAFAQYAFNKSHSTCYAFVAYQTGYLKAHYPSEYMAAVLNHAGDIDKITFFLEECKSMGLKVLGPDINESHNGFTVNKKGEIRFGLGGLKGVGEAAIESLVGEREKNGAYKDVFDFITRVNQRTVNKKSIESLIYSGAFDCFEDLHRAQYFHIAKGETVNGIEKIVKFGQQLTQQAESSLNTLFGDLNESVITQPPKLAPCEPWTLTEKLEHEKQVTGMYMTGHPLDHFKFELKHFGITKLGEFASYGIDETPFPSASRTIKLAGLVTSVNHRQTKTGKNFGNFVIEDYSGKHEFTLWSNDYALFSPFLEVGFVVFISGNFKVRRRMVGGEWVDSGMEFQVKKMNLLETLAAKETRALEFYCQPYHLNEGFIKFIEKNFNENPGSCPVKFKIRDREKNYDVEMTLPGRGININDELTQFLIEEQGIEMKVLTAD